MNNILLPSEIVMIELLCHVNSYLPLHHFALVLRGSLLQRIWLGETARPAGDVDLEIVFYPTITPQVHEWYNDLSAIECVRNALCNSTEDVNKSILFTGNNQIREGDTLWEYDSPGQRYHANWQWAEKGLAENLQIDIAQSQYSDLIMQHLAPISLTDLTGNQTNIPAYTQELQLASKMYWLLKSVRYSRLFQTYTWRGEIKDIFDVYSLLQHGSLDSIRVRSALLAIWKNEKLQPQDWLNLKQLVLANLPDQAFNGWNEFRHIHNSLIDKSPAMMLKFITEKIELLIQHDLSSLHPALLLN
jgi:hypothetical protein